MTLRPLLRGLTAGLLAVAVALTATGCIPGSSDPAPPAAAEQPPFDGTSATLAAGFERAGVAVADLDAPDEVFAEHTVVLTPDQVNAMAEQAAARSGVEAGTLDWLAGSSADDPETVPPLSYVLAGWARDWTGEGAAMARAIMGDQNWLVPEGIVWPDAVLALFLADITADITAEERDFPVVDADTAARVSTGLDIGALCTAGANFVQKALATIYQTIEAVAQKAENGIGGFFGKIVGLGIRLVKEVVKGVVDTVSAVLDKVLAPIKSALIVVGIVQQVGSAIRPWTITIAGDPTHMVSAEVPVPGTFTATVKSAIPDFPGWVRECAAAIGLDLPRPPGAGSTVTWTFAPLIGIKATPLSMPEQVVGDDSTSTFEYEANADPPEAWAGDPLDISIVATVSADRTEIERLSHLADNLIDGALSSLPPIISGIVKKLVAAVRAEAVKALTELLTPAATGSTSLPFTIHTEPQPEKPPLTQPAVPDPASTSFCAALAGYGQWEMSGAMWTGTVSDIYKRQQAVFAVAPAELRPVLSVLFPGVDDDPAFQGDTFAVTQGWVDAHCAPGYRATVQAWFTMAKWFRAQDW